MRVPARAFAAALLALAACAPPPEPAGERLTLAPVDFAELPGWTADAAAEAFPALRRSCQRYLRLPPDRAIGEDGLAGTAADWSGPCGALGNLGEAPDDAAARAYFETWFHPFRAANGDDPDGLFTGYYEAELKGALAPDERFRVPLFGLPSDLVTVDLGQFDAAWRGQTIVGRLGGRRLTPYPARADIEAGGLAEAAAPILWVEDAVDAHILHIQGSGRVLLADGGVVRVGYAGNNGHKFQGLGRILIDKGKVPKDRATMQDIRAWLKANPEQAPALMAENPRFIFFRRIDGEGPVGAMGVPLTPTRSLAVDPRFIPLGVPLWLDSSDPDGRPLRRLMVAQDTGSAIKGPVRGDFFWGAGEPALAMAGRMKSRGRYYLLLPRQRTARMAMGD